MGQQLNSEIKTITVNTVKVPVIDSSFDSSRGGKERTSVMGSGVRLGSTGQNVPGSCSFELAYPRDFDLDSLDIEDGQIRIIWDRKNEWLMTGADLMTPIGASAPEGRLTVSFEGDPWKTTK